MESVDIIWGAGAVEGWVAMISFVEERWMDGNSWTRAGGGDVRHVIPGAMSNKGMVRAKCNDIDGHEEGDGRTTPTKKEDEIGYVGRDPDRGGGDPVLSHAAGGAGGRADLPRMSLKGTHAHPTPERRRRCGSEPRGEEEREDDEYDNDVLCMVDAGRPTRGAVRERHERGRHVDRPDLGSSRPPPGGRRWCASEGRGLTERGRRCNRRAGQTL